MASTDQPAPITPSGAAVPAQPVSARPVLDVGLRAFMLRVYNYMGLSLVITAAVAYATFAVTTTTDVGAAALSADRPFALGDGLYLTPLGATFYTGPWFVLAACSPLVGILLLYLGMWLSRSAALALALFFSISMLFGLGLSVTLIVYTEASIAKVFAISAATFGAMSLYGYTTQRDLTYLGSFLVMGLFGLILATVVNLVFRSPGLDFVLSIVGILIFTGLTAYDTQKIKECYAEADAPDERTRKAIMGALQLYLDFINLTLQLLKIFGKLRGSSS